MKLIVGNFKMNLTLDEINDYISNLKNNNFSNVVFCPSYIYLKMFIDNNFIVGSQDISSFEEKESTGDISAFQLKQLGVKYAIVGHSERRKKYNDDKYINDKLKICLKNDLIPILCIGETKDEYDNDETKEVLKKQLDDALTNHSQPNIIIAYEPIWAIGTGIIPLNEKINNIVDYIKKYVYDKYGINVLVLYGGSVNNKNIDILEQISNLDGYLIGGCSTKVLDFITLINYVNNN